MGSSIHERLDGIYFTIKVILKKDYSLKGLVCETALGT